MKSPTTTTETQPLLPLVGNAPTAADQIDVGVDPRKPSHSTLGLLCVGASALCFSLMSAIVKIETAEALNFMEAVFWRSLIAAVLAAISARITGRDVLIPRELRALLLLRCLIGFACISCTFYALARMTLADASVLLFTSPIVTFCLGACVLGERIDHTSFGCAVLGFGGVLCVVRPDWFDLGGIVVASSSTATTTGPSINGLEPTADPTTSTAPTAAILAALASAVLQAGVYTTVRQLRRVHFLIMLQYSMGCCAVLSFLAVWLVNGRPVRLPSSAGLRGFVAANGLLTFLGQCFLTKGLQLEHAGAASVMRYLDVVFVFAWDMALLHEPIHLASVVGAVIILVSASALTWRRQRQARQQQQQQRHQ